MGIVKFSAFFPVAIRCHYPWRIANPGSSFPKLLSPFSPFCIALTLEQVESRKSHDRAHEVVNQDIETAGDTTTGGHDG